MWRVRLGTRGTPELAKEPVTPLVEDFVDRWNHEQRQHRRRNDATDDCAAEWRTEVGAFALAECDWNHAGNERERRHHDGAKSRASRFDKRLAQRQPAILTRPLREVDQQDG